MKLRYDFSSLWAVADQIGAAKTNFTLSRSTSITEIEAELIKGKEVLLEELEVVQNLLAYEGRQILLYIPDQGVNISRVLAGQMDLGKKFHVAHCDTLVTMKQRGRFERYIATTDISGEFDLTGIDESRQTLRGKSRLYVCQNCLNLLNYKQSKVNRSAKIIRETFSLPEFFETYSSCFRYLPRRSLWKEGDDVYTVDWKTISEKLRAASNWTCRKCRVSLNDHRALLHVHHADGVKSNNDPNNLHVLCKACHRQEPMHDHLYVSREEMKVINGLRREQGLLQLEWSSVFKHADPCLHGVLGLAKAAGWPPPEIEIQLPGCDEAVEVAWTRSRVAINISGKVRSTKWVILSLAESATYEF